jgi:serine phosphatase RsbU (regulator of sigma subunit)
LEHTISRLRTSATTELRQALCHDDQKETHEDMAQDNVPTENAVTPHKRDAVSARLHGHWPAFARVGWGVVLLLVLGLSVASIPSYFASLHHILTTPSPPDFGGPLTSSTGLQDLRAAGLSLDFYASYNVLLSIVLLLASVAVGLLIFLRRFDTRIALLASFTLILFPTAGNTVNLATLPPAWMLLVQSVHFLSEVCLGLFFYLFPGGQFVPRWVRWLTVGLIAYWAAAVFLPTSHLSIPLRFMLFFGLGVSQVLVQVYRYRRVSSPLERQQTRWVVFGIAVALGGTGIEIVVLYALLPLFFHLSAFAYMIGSAMITIVLLFFPLSLGIAILRSQLWEIDIIINRTLVYGSLTATLALLYFGLIFALQFLLRGIVNQTSAPVVIASTLVIAALFHPLRRRLQTSIARRFYRQMYDAARLIAAFTSTLREEIDLDQLHERLIAAVRDALLPRSVALWLRATGPSAEHGTFRLAQWRPHEQQQHRTEHAHEASAEGIGTAIFPRDAPFAIEVTNDDALVTSVLHTPDVVEIDRRHLDSPLWRALEEAEVEITLPLISRGALIGLLNLGPRLSGQDYAPADRALLNTLSTQITPALRVAQMVREQQGQVRERERMEQELRTAQLIQRSLLPEAVPTLAGWQIATYYQPAREVGGDFYDFLLFADGRLGLVIGDVSGKGVPAALVMASTRSMLRAAAHGMDAPGEVLARVNELLCADASPKMFVTCFYALLDPGSGKLRYANAGHDLPYRRQAGAVWELRATGMPLGWMPGRHYEEQEVTIAPDECILFFSDGLVEAHNPGHEMFGLPHLKRVIAEHAAGVSLIDRLLSELKSYTDEGWEQEDDVTLVTLQRTPV